MRNDLPDVRGWEVQAGDGEHVGEVRNLIVDRLAGRVRYLELELASVFADRDGGRRVLLPVGLAVLDENEDVVRVLTASATDVLGIEQYGGDGVTREYEVQVRRTVFGALSLPASCRRSAPRRPKPRTPHSTSTQPMTSGACCRAAVAAITTRTSPGWRVSAAR